MESKMPMGPGRFENVFRRLNVELERLKRIGIPTKLIEDFKKELVRYRPVNPDGYVPPLYPLESRKLISSPYAIAVNRYEGFLKGEFTWEYYLKAWEECNDDDKARLNELTDQPLNAVE
jgi:hypothetical protein